MGERLSALIPVERLRAITSVFLLMPQIPMLFMGEEWASDRPFNFFTDFHGELADAVREGRRKEFAGFAEFSDPKRERRSPIPTRKPPSRARNWIGTPLRNRRMPSGLAGTRR